MPNRDSASGTCLLIVNQPAGGAWNMALDEILLENAAQDPLPTLRIYRWQRPTLSLGYFQSYAERQSHRPSLNADVVRRLSGGGAILHDQEITYSLVLPSTHPLAANTQLLYDKVHQAILDWLRELSAQAGFSGQLALCEPPQRESDQHQEPFMCFQRRSPGDILLRGDGPKDVSDHKIVGSAQRRRRGGVLQHGSVLWSTSSAAPEIDGFTNLTGVEVPLATATDQLSARILFSLHLDHSIAQLSPELLAAAEERRLQRYDLTAWTERR